MKLKANILLITITLLAYWAGLSNANAFYDPGAQRWLNRDPIQEAGGINLYRIISNDPVGFIDLFGLYGNPVPPCFPYPGCAGSPRPLSPRAPLPISYPPTSPRPKPSPLPRPMPPVIAPKPVGGGVLGVICLILTPTSIGPEPPHDDCFLVGSTAGMCIYECPSAVGPWHGYLPRDYPDSPCPGTANSDDVIPK